MSIEGMGAAMAVGTLAAFWMVSFLLVITPGADWAYAITAGLRYRSVLPAVGGMVSGHLAATVVVAAGVAALLAGSPVVMTVLTVAGALYLVWLGVTTFAEPPTPIEDTGPETGSWRRQALKGAGTSGLNPKLFLLFLALLPQFTDPNGSWPIATQIVVLGLLHVLSCAVIYTAVGVGSRVVLRTRPATARAVARCSGAAMVAIGIALLIEQVIHVR